MKPSNIPQMNKRFMVYRGAQPVTVTASGTATDGIAINDNADFYCEYITAIYTSPLLLFQLRVSSRNFFDGLVRIDLIAGGQIITSPSHWKTPIYFTRPIEMKRKERVLIDYSDKSTSTNLVYLAFVGYEVY